MKSALLRRSAAAAAVVVLTVTLTACGGEDEKSPAADSTSTVDPETQGYLDAVAPICDSTQADLQAISDSYAKTPTEEQFSASLQEASDLILGQIEEIRAVEPPAELAEAVTAWLESLEDAATGMPALTVADANKGLDVFAESDPRARELGLASCTSNGA